MCRPWRSAIGCLVVFVVSQVAATTASADAISFATDTYTLPNGLTVTLHEDHSLPQVVVNFRVGVGSKDERDGRSGFAHLFEHLMFMGTGRVPDSQFDVIMETGGGWNNAWTSSDLTNYYSVGPSALLPTLLWLDADRLDALSRYMTQEKLDLQRDVVRNERREGVDNEPYGKSDILLAETLYPEGHPYDHTTIGSHEDLEAATLQDVIDFFDTYYVPSNLQLVVAGDFDPAAVRPLIDRMFGALAERPIPYHRTAVPNVVGEPRAITAEDRVEDPRLYLVWSSPAHFSKGDGEMDVIAELLTDGASSRLQKRLIYDDGLAQDITAYQASAELGSEFNIISTARPGASLDDIQTAVMEELERFAEEGPTPAELKRVQASLESAFVQRAEDLVSRATAMNQYLHHFGTADGFQRDLDRWLSVTVDDIRNRARDVFADGYVDLRIYPEGEAPESEAPQSETMSASVLDERPSDFDTRPFEPEVPATFTLSNGIQVAAMPRPGHRLFAGAVLVSGGCSLDPADKAGLAELTTRVMNAGAGNRTAAEFADAVSSLGASVDVSVGRLNLLTRVEGLTSKLDETLDLFADVVLRPDLRQEDFDRESGLLLDELRSRETVPRAVANVATRALLFGPESPYGRPMDGYVETVERISHADVVRAAGELVVPNRAHMVFVGDFDVPTLKRALESRFGKWKKTGAPWSPPPPVLVASGRLVLVDRPEAAQTVITIARPVDVKESERATRSCLQTLFGGSFTSRLNQNLREKNGYTYGAGCRIREDRSQGVLLASSAVRADVTGAALREFKTEFDAISTGDVTEDEVRKARLTRRSDLIATAETTNGLANNFAALIADDRPLSAIGDEIRALETVTVDDVRGIATSGLLNWDSMLVVLVGDAASVREQLEEAGFPEPVMATAEGKLVAATDQSAVTAP